MEKKVYRTDWKNGPLFGLVGIIIFLLLIFVRGGFEWNNFEYVFDSFLGIFVLIFIALDTFFGIYVTITDTRVTKTSFFFYKQSLEFKDIDQIYYGPAFIIRTGDYKMWLISNKNERKTLAVMNNRFFKGKDMNELLSIIRKKNPSVQVDINNPIKSASNDRELS